MGFFGFLFRTWWGIAISAVTGIIALVVVVAVVVFLLATVGDPGSCTPGGGPISVSAANAAAFDQKWDALDAILDAGSPTSTTFNESELTSRADRFVDEAGGDIKDVRVCIHDGFGEVTGSVDFFLGDAKFKAKGTVRLIGDHPEVEIDDIDVGNVPGFLTGLLEGVVEDAIKELLDDIDLEHTYSPTLTEGQVRIDGQP